MMRDSSIHDRHAAVRARMAAAAQAAGRKPEDIQLIAVSKQQEDSRIEEMLRTGQRCFGENRVQEAAQRWAARRPAITGLSLHLIGPLQTNKALEAVRLFDVIESLDRPKLARALADAVQKAGRAPAMLVQVNTGEEAQKAGILPPHADQFLQDLRQIYALSPMGLMCIPPQNEPAAPHFALLAKIAARNDLPWLSMGMSEDFETAIRFGATHVRVGSALFGQRQSRAAISPEGLAPGLPEE